MLIIDSSVSGKLKEILVSINDHIVCRKFINDFFFYLRTLFMYMT